MNGASKEKLGHVGFGKLRRMVAMEEDLKDTGG
jgi:hypothetical protein